MAARWAANHIGSLFFLVTNLWPTIAPAGTPRVVRISGDADACPNPTAVAAALAPLLPKDRVTTESIGDFAVAVQVVDLGSRYRVSVAGSDRDFSDETRSCDDRAQAAAVFAAVLIEPPTVAIPERLA